MKAKELGDVADALKDVAARVDRFLGEARRITGRSAKDLGESILILRELRQRTYEDLNQLQHEYMALAAIEWLINNGHCSPATKWFCHLQQTSGKGEPDLSGKYKGRYIVWAEVTASEDPEGVIDTRIRDALWKLHQKPKYAEKFYFVRTEAKCHTSSAWNLNCARVSARFTRY